jgi:GTP-binding protein HflX
VCGTAANSAAVAPALCTRNEALNIKANHLKQTRANVARERAILVEVISDDTGAVDENGNRDQLEELGRLADAAGVVVVGEMTQRRKVIHPGTYIGKGKVEELKELAHGKRANVVIFDNDLTPGQIRNLEEELACKTIDRSELILDIFATRARTTEARLQVELAQLEYTYPRLKQFWTHLSRLEAGGGIGLRGPGETQLESDRRLVRDRIVDLKKRLKEIDARREREVQSRGGAMTVGIVGYTNAGKSSLLNALTGSDVYVEDKLFATLDTRTRSWRLPHRVTALVSDTVGFIRNLPHHLVASFKATLEEAVHADLLLHVVDVSTEHWRADMEAVAAVLKEINCSEKPQLVVLNKADLVEDPLTLDLARRGLGGAVVASAKTGLGLEALGREVLRRLAGEIKEVTVRADVTDGKLLAWIDEHGEVLSRHTTDDEVVQTVRLPERLLAKIDRVATQKFVVET